MGSLTRKQVDYFEMFTKGIEISLKAAKSLQAAFADGAINETELRHIKTVEHEGDRHVHESLKIIDMAFITPIDRTDILEVLKSIENITDSFDAIANHIYIMHITRSNKFLCKFVDLAVISCERLRELMVELKQFRKRTNRINELIIEVNRLEEEGDSTYTDSMRNLFQFEKDPIAIIKNKELYQLFENTLDCCEDVADMVEKIVISTT